MDDDVPTMDLLVIDSPFHARYVSESGELVLTMPMGTLSGDRQMNARVRLTAEALGNLRDVIDELEREAKSPPSQHRKPRSIQ